MTRETPCAKQSNLRVLRKSGLLLFFVLLIVGFSNKKLTIVGVLKGFIPFILSLLISSLFAFYGSLLSVTRGAWLAYLFMIIFFAIYIIKLGLFNKKYLFSLLKLILILNCFPNGLILDNLIFALLLFIPKEITFRFFLYAIFLCNSKKLSSVFNTTKPLGLMFLIISDFAKAICLILLKFFACA